MSRAAPFAAWRANERHERRVCERMQRGLAKIERMTDVDAIFRARMRALAHRGGAATKKLAIEDPQYFRRVGRLGGLASIAARKRRIYAELEGRVCGPATLQASEPTAQAPPPPQTAQHLTLLDVLGPEALLEVALGPASSRTSRR
jgi:hypothetical protein